MIKKKYMLDLISPEFEKPLPSNDKGKIMVKINDKLFVLVKRGTNILKIKQKYATYQR